MQHARPIGPTTNLAATFGPEMSAGSRPERPRLFSSRTRQGLSLSQTTHVQATFIPAMTLALVPPKPRYMATSHQGQSGWTVEGLAFGIDKFRFRPDRQRYRKPALGGQPWWTPEVEAFGIESVLGSLPNRPRLFLAPKIPLHTSPHTHDQAAFSEDMIAGVTAPRLRYVSPFHNGGQWWTAEIDFVGQDSVAGSHPDRSRALLGARIGLPVSQTTHDQAAFSIDMVDPALAPRSRYTTTSHQGVQWWSPDVDPFGIESVIGARPDRARVQLGPRLGQPTQPTHTSAAFSVEMAQGCVPTKSRYSAPLHAGVQWWTAEVLSFSVEMAMGARPDRPRIQLGPKIALPVSQPTHTAATFGPEMAQGVIAPRHRHLSTSHQGVQWLAEVPAFAFEGIVGWTPKSQRYTAPFHQGWQAPEQFFLFSVEMAQGSHPDKNRAFLAPRFQQAPSQLTHVQAAFTPDMVQGTFPVAKFRGYVPIKVGWDISATLLGNFSVLNLNNPSTVSLMSDRYTAGLGVSRTTVSLMVERETSGLNATRASFGLNPDRSTTDGD